MSADKIFIVEDDKNIRDLIAYALKSSDFEVRGFEGGDSLYKALENEIPDIFILDIMLDGDDGYTILEKIRSRARTKDIPVIMLTAKTGEYDKVKGLDMGADDYVTKPFGVMELISRVRAVLRRARPYKNTEDEYKFTYKDLVLDTAKRSVSLENEAVDLSYKEFELLRYLMENEDRVLTRDEIMSEVWGFDYRGETRTVDVHIRTLRHKLGPHRDYIKTIRNVGYKIGD